MAVTWNHGTCSQTATVSEGEIDSYTNTPDRSVATRSGPWSTLNLSQELVKSCTASSSVITWNSFTFTYDALGSRVQGADFVGGTSCTVRDASKDSTLLCAATSTSASSYIYLGDRLLFRVDSATSTQHYYLQDYLGSTREVWFYAGATFTAEAKYRYQPFGVQATPNLAPNTMPRFQYAGQDASQDPNLDLYHMGARYYAPDLGRFVSRDPVGSHGYAYARDDPMVYWDPSGLDSQGIDWAALGALLAGAAVVAGVIACGLITGGVCLGVVGTLLLAAAAGAAAATVITAREGGQVTLGTVFGGALLGLSGGLFAYGGALALASLAPESALASAITGMAYGGLGAGGAMGAGAVSGVAGEQEEDLDADLSARPPINQIVDTGGIQGGAPEPGEVLTGNAAVTDQKLLASELDESTFAPGRLQTPSHLQHAADMGLTPDEYVQQARQLLKQGVLGEGGVQLFVKGSSSDLYVVDPVTGNLAEYSMETGYIRTFFTLPDWQTYIVRQMEQEGWYPASI